MAGGLVITFSCPITLISLRVVQLSRSQWRSGCRCGRASSSRELAAGLDITPPIWQPDYFDRYLRSQENYGRKWNYVEQNALRAGLINEGEQWPYGGSIFDLMW
jgi:hypothetical protein